MPPNYNVPAKVSLDQPNYIWRALVRSLLALNDQEGDRKRERERVLWIQKREVET